MKRAKRAVRPVATVGSKADTGLVLQVAAALKAQGMMLVTAESCTGGGIAQELTSVSGSSVWFERGFVTYSNAAKEEMLGVSPQTLEEDGAVSETTVREMAEGALQYSRAQVAVAVSGIAGPGGGTAQKPVGTVWFAWACNGEVRAACHQFSGDREAIRVKSVRAALQGIVDLLNKRNLQ